MLITPLEDYSGTYYIMWDDENFYIALSVQDDQYAYNANPASADCLQFTLGENIDDTYKPSHYLPTVCARDPEGNPEGRNVFGNAAWYKYDLFANPEVQYNGHVDDETQDWSVELKIPWAFMIGDFLGDLANGDADGDGKNVFPPDLGDQVGFTIQPRDWDLSDAGAPQLQMSATNLSWTYPWGLLEGRPVQEPMTFVGPAE